MGVRDVLYVLRQVEVSWHLLGWQRLGASQGRLKTRPSQAPPTYNLPSWHPARRQQVLVLYISRIGRYGPSQAMVSPTHRLQVPSGSSTSPLTSRHRVHYPEHVRHGNDEDHIVEVELWGAPLGRLCFRIGLPRGRAPVGRIRDRRGGRQPRIEVVEVVDGAEALPGGRGCRHCSLRAARSSLSPSAGRNERRRRNVEYVAGGRLSWSGHG